MDLNSRSIVERITFYVKHIPVGKVATYGQIADMAGNPRASRVVVRVLNTVSKTEKLPWHRVINSKGMISLKRGHGYEMQKHLLESEGVIFNDNDRINLKQFQWRGS